ncbi:integrase arm-type DNA-binding domain-containing protein [Phenylobacterium sp. LjRoot225]|uniref:tyrosine-type recombinase/integrase n=1 Tax=Phenylobacterium sp. LjRoot225 TaxID=3342285 RepID=UPI003ECD6A97
MGLTVKKIERLKDPGRYADGGGLYLQVMSPSNKSWLFRYQRNVRDEDGRTVLNPKGRPLVRERWMGLGPLHTFDLPEARELARAKRKLLADGIDPLDAKQSERAERARAAAKRKTFKQAAEAYFEKQEESWSNLKHRAQFLSTLETYAFPVLGDLPVDAITTDDLLRVFNAEIKPRKGAPADAGPQRFWLARPETARRVRTRIEAVLAWATFRGFRSGENPARWVGHLKHELPAQGDVDRNQPALPWQQTAVFLAELKGREGIAPRALEFLILTAMRTSEVTGAKWSEVNLTDASWTIPAERMKMKRPHTVPLSPRAVQILETVPREDDNPFVFVGGIAGKGLSNAAMAELVKRMNTPELRWVDAQGEAIVPHGFRSTFRDWAAERTRYPNHVVEMALAHVVGNKVEAAYRRGQLLDWRKRLMKDWATYCETPTPADREGDNVVALGAGR